MIKVQDLMDNGTTRVETSDRRQIVAGRWRFILFFWLSLTLFYAAFSPSTISFMGYMEENLTAAEQVTDNLLRLARGEAPAKVGWTHHGCTEVLLEAPFLLLSRVFFGASRAWNGRVIVLQSILATSLLCALLLCWTHRLTGSWVWAYWLALSAGIATMLWPYAYIWMETTQSLFLLLAGYLALGREPKRTWGELLLFTVSCAIAVSAKQTGIFLLPALFLLVWAYCRDQERAGWAGLAKRWKEAAIVMAAILAAVALNRYTRNTYWDGQGGEENYIASIFTDSPLTFLFNLIGYFGSPNKSLFIYAPLTLLCVLALWRARALRPDLVIWTLLTLGGLAGGFALLVVWTEETWGPRYLHSAIAPLVICLAVTLQGQTFQWRRQKLLLAAVILGTACSFLGVCFHYGVLYLSASRSSQSTLEAIQGDSRFNHVSFNWRLFRVWGRGRLGLANQPEKWPPEPFWWFKRPDDAPQLKQVDLCEVAIPIPVLFRGWNEGSSATPNTYRVLRAFCAVCLLVGIAGLCWSWRKASKLEESDDLKVL
jgi:hypothetical protein